MSGRSQLIKLVSISTINIFFFTDLFILFFDWSQLLFIVEILFVFSFQTPRMKFSAQIWAFIVYAWEIQLLVNWIAIWAPCVLVHELLLLVLRQEVPLVVVPSLIEVVLREQFVILNFNFFMDRIAFEYYLFALTSLWEILTHVPFNMPWVIPALLDAFENRLLLQIPDLFFLILDLLDGLVNITVVVTQLWLLVALSSDWKAWYYAWALVVRPIQVFLKL